VNERDVPSIDLIHRLRLLGFKHIECYIHHDAR